MGSNGCLHGTSPEMPENNEVANVNDASDFDHSRGGTRTRDPGIMSENATPVDRDSTSEGPAYCGEERRPNDA